MKKIALLVSLLCLVGCGGTYGVGGDPLDSGTSYDASTIPVIDASEVLEDADIPDATRIPPVEHNYSATFCDDIEAFSPSNHFWMCKCFGRCSSHHKCHSECEDEQTCYYCQMKLARSSSWSMYEETVPAYSDFAVSTQMFIWNTFPHSEPWAGLISSSPDAYSACLIDQKHSKLRLITGYSDVEIVIPFRYFYRLTLSFANGEALCEADEFSVSGENVYSEEESEVGFYTVLTRACFKSLELRTVTRRSSNYLPDLP